MHPFTQYLQLSARMAPGNLEKLIYIIYMKVIYTYNDEDQVYDRSLNCNFLKEQVCPTFVVIKMTLIVVYSIFIHKK